MGFCRIQTKMGEGGDCATKKWEKRMLDPRVLAEPPTILQRWVDCRVTAALVAVFVSTNSCFLPAQKTIEHYWANIIYFSCTLLEKIKEGRYPCLTGKDHLKRIFGHLKTPSITRKSVFLFISCTHDATFQQTINTVLLVGTLDIVINMLFC